MSSQEGSKITFRRAPVALRPRAIANFARRLEREVAGGRPFGCLITGDLEMRRLNRKFREMDYAADVLSFPAKDRPGGLSHLTSTRVSTRHAESVRYKAPLGELAISLARARAQARSFGHQTED